MVGRHLPFHGPRDVVADEYRSAHAHYTAEIVEPDVERRVRLVAKRESPWLGRDGELRGGIGEREGCEGSVCLFISAS